MATATDDVAIRASWGLGLLPLIAITTALGLLVIAVANGLSRSSSPIALAVWWAGYALLVIPILGRLLRASPGRPERIGLLLVLGFALYLVKVFQSPIGFTLPDEFSHLRTLEDILFTGRLGAVNPLLGPSPSYPGLEISTAADVNVAGLSMFSAGTLVVGLGRLLVILGTFLLIELLSGSPRVGGVGTAIYMANGSFLFFDAAFSYESLAIGLAIIALWASIQAERAGEARVVYFAGALAAITATTMTHHLTSLLVDLALVAWAVVAILRPHGPDGRRIPLLLAVVALAINGVWLATFASPAIVYLSKIFGPGLDAALQVLTGQLSARELFAPVSGYAIPLPEIVASYAAVLVIALTAPFAALSVFRRRRSDAIVLIMIASLPLYPVALVLRLVGAASEIAGRMAEFVFLPIGFVIADWLINGWPAARPRLAAVAWAGLIVLFAGTATLGEPYYLRLPGPYRVAAESRSIEPVGEATASWALATLGPGNRFLADRTNTKLLGSIGWQFPVTDYNSGVATAYIAFDGGLGPLERQLIAQGRVRYMLADWRLTQALPVFPFYFEQAEPGEGERTTAFPPEGIAKFNATPEVDRIFDGGNLVIFDLRQLLP